MFTITTLHVASRRTPGVVLWQVNIPYMLTKMDSLLKSYEQQFRYVYFKISSLTVFNNNYDFKVSSLQALLQEQQHWME
jgi:hypothetical protein